MVPSKGLESFDFPAFAVLFADVLGGGGFVGELEFVGVPFEVLAGEAGGDSAEQDGFGEGACVVEVGGGGAVAAAGFDEGVPVIDFVEFGVLEAVEIFFRVESRFANVWEEHDAFGSDKDGALAGDVFTAEKGLDVFGWAFVAVIPGDIHGFTSGEGGLGEGVADDGVGGPVVFVGFGASGFEGKWGGEGYGFEDGVVDVAAHVTEGSCAVVEAFAPLSWVVVALDVVGVRSGADPVFPVQAFGHFVFSVWFWGVIAPLFAAPCVDFLDLSDHAILNDLNCAAVEDMGVDLDSHLGDEAFFFGIILDLAALVDVVGEGFLAVDMFAELHGGHGHGGVKVVWGGDVDAVNVAAFFVEHFPPVCVNFGFGEALLKLFAAPWIKFGTGDEVYIFGGGNGGEVSHCHASTSEAGVSKGLAGRVLSPGGAGYVRHRDAGSSELFEERATIGFNHGYC